MEEIIMGAISFKPVQPKTEQQYCYKSSTMPIYAEILDFQSVVMTWVVS